MLSNANWPSPFRNATMALPKKAHMRRGGSFFMLIATQTFFLQLTFTFLQLTCLLWTKGVQCLTSWNFELLYFCFFCPGSVLDHPLAPSSLISYAVVSFPSRRPHWLVAFGAFSTEMYWLHWRSRAAQTPPQPQHLPILFVFKWACLCGSAAVRINAQISAISLRLHVCQTMCCKGITRCLLDAARRWQLPRHLVFAFRRAARNQMAAT